MVRLRQDTLIAGNELFKELKGALTEQYVLQQFKTLKGIDPSICLCGRWSRISLSMGVCHDRLIVFNIHQFSQILRNFIKL